jgi:hypothetical protein
LAQYQGSKGHSATSDEAVSSTIVAGGRARIRLNIEVDIKILISTLIYRINLIALTVALEQTCARPPKPQAVWIHQIHAAGGMGGSATMVAVFIGLVVCCGWSCDVTSSSYEKLGQK